MHGSYRRAFGPESVVELHKNVIIQHEDYLKQDDPDKKADALRYMAGYVVQYLHLVPQEKKFTFKETERVLHNSAMNIGEFDPREGSIAFHNLAKYAENLLEQPWRKDFHVIKLTSGFYVHNISAQLQNAHEILIVMGYVNIDDTTLKLIPNQNYNNLKAVSRDCYVASQECLILSQIWQHVADQEPDYPLTIGEVFEYRKNHLGDTDTICNKLLYDIRVRMHAAKQQQQLHQLHHQQQNHLKNTQRFVPVDRLIDYDAEDGTNPDPDDVDTPQHPSNFVPEREIERTQEQLKNINVYGYNQDDEHIYDPVYTGDMPVVPPHGYQRKLSYPSPQQQKIVANNLPAANSQYFYNNNATRKSMPASAQPPSYHQHQQQHQTVPQQQYHHNNFSSNSAANNIMLAYGNDRNSVSPMIPKTVTSLFSSGSRNNVSKSNSMNSLNGVRGMVSSSSSSSMSQNFGNQPLTRSKVKETDLDSDLRSPRADAVPPYLRDNGNSRLARKSMPASMSIPPPPPNSMNHNQVYPDQFYPPGIVKPVAVYGSSQNAAPLTSVGTPPQMPYNSRGRFHSDNSEDVLNEAYAYASEVGQLPKGAPTTPGRLATQPAYQHQATPIPLVHGSDSESIPDSNKSRNSSVPRELAHDRINNAIRSGSSTDASSPWDGSSTREGTYSAHHQNRLPSRKTEPPMRPSHIDLRQNDIRHADSSPESAEAHQQAGRNKSNGGGYRELSSGSSSGSPASTSSRNYPRNEELNSLDTVYFDYLLKQGQTDEVLASNPSPSSRNSNKSNLSNNEQQQQPRFEKTHRRTGSLSRSSSSQPQPQHVPETEETHIYDGRRVVPKKHNDTVIRKKQNPGENNTTPQKTEANYNLLSTTSGEMSKPSHHDKHLKKASNNQNGGSRMPEEGEDPSQSSTSPPPKKPVEPWDCRFCTFRNLVEERICEVCAKSKDFYEDLEQSPAPPLPSQQQSSSAAAVNREQAILPKMYSVPNTNVASVTTNGGQAQEEEEEKECPQCTLLNPVRARVCDACNFRLKPVESSESSYDNR